MLKKISHKIIEINKKVIHLPSRFIKWLQVKFIKHCSKKKIVFSLSTTSSMNILLCCIEHNEQNRKEFIEAKNIFYSLPEEELESVVEWWNKKELVGEVESELALAIVNGSLKD